LRLTAVRRRPSQLPRKQAAPPGGFFVARTNEEEPVAADTNVPAPRKYRHRWRGILRPRKCSRTAAERVLSLIGHGYGLREIAARNGMPTVDTICRWIADNEDFRKRYEAARRARAEMLADEAAVLKAQEMRFRIQLLKRRIEDARRAGSDADAGTGAPSRPLDEETLARFRAVLDGTFDPLGERTVQSSEHTTDE
jgi:hypothetical protein